MSILVLGHGTSPKISIQTDNDFDFLLQIWSLNGTLWKIYISGQNMPCNNCVQDCNTCH